MTCKLSSRLWDRQEKQRVLAHYRGGKASGICVDRNASDVSIYGRRTRCKTRSDKLNRFRMLSDGTNYTFACLNNNQRLLISRIFQWLFDRQTILRHIDRIPLDAIQSSPHTRSVKLNKSNICGYMRYLQGSWRFGEDSDDEGEEGDKNDVEGDLVDVIKKNGRIFLRSKRSARDFISLIDTAYPSN